VNSAGIAFILLLCGHMFGTGRRGLRRFAAATGQGAADQRKADPYRQEAGLLMAWFHGQFRFQNGHGCDQEGAGLTVQAMVS
jgi:hypothetical protein